MCLLSLIARGFTGMNYVDEDRTTILRKLNAGRKDLCSF